MSDWLPGSRSEILNMCRIWISYMTADLRTLWGVTQAEFTNLGTLYGAAQALLQKAQDEAERTQVVTGLVQEAFRKLSSSMRDMRDRRFKQPPMTLEDWLAMGFREKSDRSPIPPPDGTPVATLSYPGAPQVILARLGPLAGTQELDPRSEYGYAVYYGIMPPGGATLEEAASKKHYLMAPPTDGEGMDHLFTKRRKERFVFDTEDAGKRVYICARYENGKGQAGKTWSPVVSAIIP